MFYKSILAAAALAVTMAGCVETTNATTTSVSQNRNVLIVNQTGRPIWRFYGSNVGTNSWEEDILGADVLQNGASVNINFDDNTGHCNFDLKAEFQNGASVVQNNVNVCRVTAVTFR